MTRYTPLGTHYESTPTAASSSPRGISWPGLDVCHFLGQFRDKVPNRIDRLCARTGVKRSENLQSEMLTNEDLEAFLKLPQNV
jgi:hypothetical protein